MIYIDPESPVIYLYPRLYKDKYTVVLIDLTVKDSINRMEDLPVVYNDRGVVGIEIDQELPPNKIYYLEVYSPDNLIIFRGKGTTGKETDNTIDNDIIRI